MISTILATELLSSLKAVLFIIAPLAGSVVLAYGVCQVVLDLRENTRKRVVDRLRGASSRRAAEAGADFRRPTPQVSGMLAGVFSRLRVTAKLQRVLDQANVSWSAPQVLVRLTLVAGAALVGLLVFRVSLVVALGLAAAAFVLPILYLYRCRKKRLNRLVAQLPDVFELLTQALRAGHSLASGMQLVAKEVPDPAGTEFGRVFHEQNLGLKIEDALRNLAERVNMLDVRFFVTAVLIQRQTGGDLAEVLDKLGAVIRDRIKLYGTVQALTAEGRLSGYVLLALPVIVFFTMLQVNRDYAMLLLTDPAGKMMLTVAIVMQLMGWAMIRKIVNIKV